MNEEKRGGGGKERTLGVITPLTYFSPRLKLPHHNSGNAREGKKGGKKKKKKEPLPLGVNFLPRDFIH